MKAEACAKGEQEGDSSEEDERMQETRTTVKASRLKERRRLTKHCPPPLQEQGVQTAGHQAWHVKRKMRRLTTSDTSTRVQATAVF